MSSWLFFQVYPVHFSLFIAGIIIYTVEEVRTKGEMEYG
jgi:hypothetical protein